MKKAKIDPTKAKMATNFLSLFPNKNHFSSVNKQKGRNLLIIFLKRCWSFFFPQKLTSQQARLKKKIVINKPLFLLEETHNYKEFRRNKNFYNYLKGQYAKKIIKKNYIVSIGNCPLNLDANIIELDKVYKYFLVEKNIHKILSDVNLKIVRGDFLVILGPSGSGKSTLLNIMSGIDSANSGNLLVNGINLNLLDNNSLTDFRRQYVGFIFQQYNLLQNLTGKENVEIGEALLPKDKKPVDIDKLLTFLEVDKFVDKYPFQLSGGQQQRFSIARALAKNPDLLFCDEPTGALDEKISNKVMRILFEINKKFKTTVILVTHNEKFAQIAKTVIRLKDGKIVKIITNPNPSFLE